MVKERKKNAPNFQTEEQNSSSDIIVRRIDEDVKTLSYFDYEVYKLYEMAVKANKRQLLYMIQEAKEEIGKAHVVAKLEYIYESNYGIFEEVWNAKIGRNTEEIESTKESKK